MDINKFKSKLEKQGYTVELATEAGGKLPAIYRVEGQGISIQLHEGDTESWKRLANPDAHQHRVDLARAADPDDKFEMDEESKLRSDLKAQVSLGDITKDEANEIVREWKDAQEAIPAP